MPRTCRRLVVVTVALALAMALVGPPAQALEASSFFDTVSAHFAGWMAGWWSWLPSSKGAESADRSVLSQGSAGVRGRGEAGGSRSGAVRGQVSAPTVGTTCVSGNPDPNGSCPP
jgi:hypothetical protein